MARCRSIITDALGSMKALAPGDDPTIDELTIGLSSFQQLLLEWHEGRGPMTDVDVSADYTAGPDQRLRIQDGAEVTITLPNAVPTLITCSPYDYGFQAGAFQPAAGSTGSADGYQSRQPRDGERVEIVGAGPGQALYFYVADLNNWASVYGLALDDTAPVNSRYAGHWGARLAERLISSWPGLDEPSSALSKRIALANVALLTRPGVARSPVAADYF